MAARATFALKAGVWFRRDRLFIVSPDSRGTACPLSGRNSTYRPVQILEAGSDYSVFCGEWCIGRIYEKRSGPRLALRFNTKGCPQTERRAPAGVIQPAG
jgi:hypothetical protein